MSSDPQEPPEPKPIEGPEHTPGDTQGSTAATGGPESPVPFTRTAAAWWALIAGSLTLIVLLIFIAQNTESAPFTFFAWHWSLPLGVAFLLAAVGGGLLTVAVGTARMLQLRHTAKKHFAAANAKQAEITGTP